MAFFFSPRIVTDGLVVYFDVNNPKCVNANQAIDQNTRLNNLAGGSLQMKPIDHETDDSTSIMSFTYDQGGFVYDQDGLSGIVDLTSTQSAQEGPNPGWESTEPLTRTDDYTFICWFKYTYGENYGDAQRRENIYGGGFKTRTSFYLSPQGVSPFNGLLRYSDAGSENGYSVGSSGNNGNDNNWHMFASTDTGGDGNQTTKFYLDGVLKQTGTSNASYDTPDDGISPILVWGSWSGTYGNMDGRSNCYLYYDRVLSDAEILQNYKALKSKFT